MTLFALLVALVSLGVSILLAIKLNKLAERLARIERGPERVPLEARHERKGELWGRGLGGLGIALSIEQDHPHPVFANLLKETLLKEDATVDDKDPDLRIEGQIVGNGYADVYFRAEIAVRNADETLFTLSDKPPHGDRPANLAAEIVQRLRVEIAKRERRLAVRELHGSE